MPQLANGDTVVALLGIVMALFLVSRHSAMQALSPQRRFGYATIWAVAIGVNAAIFARFSA